MQVFSEFKRSKWSFLNETDFENMVRVLVALKFYYGRHLRKMHIDISRFR